MGNPEKQSLKDLQEEKNNSMLPSISIAIVTYNCAHNLRECLSRINSQNYPKEKIEILVVDGGSTDDTLLVAKSFRAKIIHGGFQDNAEARRGIALLHAENDIIAYIDSDIFLPTSSWLNEMIMPLIENRNMVATQPLMYEYRKNDTALNRYFSLLGVHDPVAYYLNKRDRFSWAEKKWNLFGAATDAGKYYIVKFNCDEMPPLGCNGFVAKKSVMRECALPNPQEVPFFTHSDATYDMVKAGWNTFGFVKNTVIHLTSSGFIGSWMKKRVYSTELLYFRQVPRRYRVYDPKNFRDNLNLLKYIIYSITILKPLYDAMRGFWKVKDVAWFIHPIMCIAMLYTYGRITIRHILRSYVMKDKR